MLASSRTSVVRTVDAKRLVRTARASTARSAARHVAGRRMAVRYQSTSTGNGPSSSVDMGHIAAGLAGGVIVLAGCYVWYRRSGIKTAVDASTTAQQYYAQAKQTVIEKARKDPNEVLEFLRSTVKSYAGFIPGVSSYVDSTFDTLDQLHNTHREDVDNILRGAYDEINGILKSKKEGLDAETTYKIFEVVKRRTSELEDVAKKAGKDLFQNLAESHPEVKEKLGGGYDQLKDLVEKVGPDAKKVLDDTSKQLQDILSKGFSSDALTQASQLIQTKTDEVRKLAEKASQEAWNKAVKEGSPYLDKLPEIKKLVNDNASKFIAAGVTSLSGSSSAARDIFSRVKDAAESGDDKKKEQLKEFVKQKAREAQEQSEGTVLKGWQALEQWIKAVPGGEEALQKVPDAKILLQLAQEHSDDAKELTRETYEDIIKVLEEKGKKAKGIANKTKEDAKEKSS